MTITLDQLKGMNLQVGEPIELEINSKISASGLIKLKGNKPWKELGYFEEINEDEKYPSIKYFQNTGNYWNTNEPTEIKSQMVIGLEKVRRLKYAD